MLFEQIPRYTYIIYYVRKNRLKIVQNVLKKTTNNRATIILCNKQNIRHRIPGKILKFAQMYRRWIPVIPTAVHEFYTVLTLKLVLL